jgi:hypothetical protein
VPWILSIFIVTGPRGDSNCSFLLRIDRSYLINLRMENFMNPLNSVVRGII